MANATPVNKPADPVDEQEPEVKSPEELNAEKAAEKASKALAGAKSKPAPELVAIRDEALAAGKKSVLINSRAVRVDH